MLSQKQISQISFNGWMWNEVLTESWSVLPAAERCTDLYFLTLSSPPLSLSLPSSILTTPFSKLTEDRGKMILPFCQKIVRLPKDALSPGGQVPHHYLESAKITQRRGLRVIYAAHMPKHTLACAQMHAEMPKHTHTHLFSRTHCRGCLPFFWLEKIPQGYKMEDLWGGSKRLI